MHKFSSIIITITLMGLIIGQPAKGATTLFLAVASNFTRPMEQIAPAFTESTGIKVQSNFASTGKLFAMIENGAPFDIFLAADSERPELLYRRGLAAKPFVYTQGRPVLWTTYSELCELKQWQQVVRSPQLRQIAIANPKTAPYGRVVRKAIDALPFQQEIVRRLVYAQNVGQAFQYAEKITDAGFTSASFALSQEGRKGCYWPVTEAANVTQKGCAIQGTKSKKEALAFVSFLGDPQAGTILQKFGYAQDR